MKKIIYLIFLSTLISCESSEMQPKEEEKWPYHIVEGSIIINNESYLFNESVISYNKDSTVTFGMWYEKDNVRLISLSSTAIKLGDTNFNSTSSNSLMSVASINGDAIYCRFYTINNPSDYIFIKKLQEDDYHLVFDCILYSDTLDPFNCDILQIEYDSIHVAADVFLRKS